MLRELFLALLLVPCAAAVEINESLLPFNGSESFAVQSPPNSTARFKLLEQTADLTVFYARNVSYDNESLQNWTVNFSIPELYLGGDYNLSATWQVNNTVNNKTANLTLQITIRHDLPDVITPAYNQSFQVVDGGFEYTITENFLPFEGTATFQLLGPWKEKVKVVECGKWLECGDQYRFNSLNKTYIPIKYSIPQNTSLGDYEREIIFRHNGTEKEATIIFHVTPITWEVEGYFWKDECFNGSTVKDRRENLAECLNEYEEFMARRYNYILDAFLNVSNCDNKTIVKDRYVVVGNVTKETWDQYQECAAERSTLQDTYATTTNELEGCRGELLTCEQELVNETGRLQNACLAKTIKQENEWQGRLRKHWMTLATATLLLILIGGLYYNYRQQNAGMLP